MTFREYYQQKFRSDIQRFKRAIPPESRNHFDHESAFTIQYEQLTKDKPHLDVIASEHRVNFALSLFLSVLVDEVCYTHFNQQYPQFRSLTFYPKFIGNCPVGCHYHLHPRVIFLAINDSFRGQNMEGRPDVTVNSLFDEASDVMKEEVFTFFMHHMTSIKPDEFWKKCVDEFPYNTRHDNKAIDGQSNFNTELPQGVMTEVMLQGDHMPRVKIDEIQSTFKEVYNFIDGQAGSILEGLFTTGGIAFVCEAKTARDQRRYISLPHGNRIYEDDWGYYYNSMGRDGQRIGQYSIAINVNFIESNEA